MTNPSGSPIPDYFALFQSMLNPAGVNPGAGAPSMFAMLDPKEVERKINELETVLTWLKGTVGMVELSLQTLKYQQSVLASMGEARKNAQSGANAGTSDLESLALGGAAMNPAMWAWNMMQKQAVPEPSKSSEPTARKPSARKSK
jgi:hypothetical protein